MSLDKNTAFWKYVEERYKGKVHRMERMYDVATFTDMRVVVEFRIPPDEADEMEIYRRINRVLEVIAEGEE